MFSVGMKTHNNLLHSIFIAFSLDPLFDFLFTDTLKDDK